MAARNDRRDPFQEPPVDKDYIGNIWGWKFSLFSLLLILLMLALMIYRHVTMNVPVEGTPVEPTEHFHQEADPQ